MKKTLLLLFIFIVSHKTFAQEISTALPDTISNWKKQHKLGWI